MRLFGSGSSEFARKLGFPTVGSAVGGSPEQVSCLSSVGRRKKEIGKRKTGKSCRKPVIVKGQWSCEEDRLLVQLVQQYGDSKWSCIAEKFPQRIAKQCRDRWQNHLRPDITKDAWSEDEDMLLIAIHKEVGNRWSEIARRMPRRSENTIKNHWNATKRRQLTSRRRGKPRPCSLLQEYIRCVTSVSPSSFPHFQNAQENRNSTYQTSYHVGPPEGRNPYLHQQHKQQQQHQQTRMTFESEVDVSSSSLEKYGPCGVFGPEPGGFVDHNMGSDFDHMSSHLTSQLEFDLKKEMDFLEMLYQ